jgi:hypothetical protein
LTALRSVHPIRRHGPEADPAVLRTDTVLDGLARRDPAPGGDEGTGDVAVRLLRALAEDVDQRLSSVSITPST